MPSSAYDRLVHMRDRIGLIMELWRGWSSADAVADQTRWAAFERHLEVISEASRDLPAEWKVRHGEHIPCTKVSGLGNLLRHVYHRLDGHILWDIYENDLAELEQSIVAMLSDQ